MRPIFAIICLAASLRVSAQPTVNLYPFAPQEREAQDGTNCYAYALAYVALTTKLNLTHNNQHNTPPQYASYKFLDKMMMKIGKKQVRAMVSQRGSRVTR